MESIGLLFCVFAGLLCVRRKWLDTLLAGGAVTLGIIGTHIYHGIPVWHL